MKTKTIARVMYPHHNNTDQYLAGGRNWCVRTPPPYFPLSNVHVYLGREWSFVLRCTLTLTGSNITICKILHHFAPLHP